MAHAHLERRPDGLLRLRPAEPRFTRAEWYVAAFTTFLIAAGEYVAAAAPPVLLAMVLVGAALGEVCFGLRAVLDLRRPPAEVVVLARARVRRAL